MTEEGVIATQAAPPTTGADVREQIETAKAYPRDIDKAFENCLYLATVTRETAARCMYALPPRDGKVIEGPSVHLAAIVAQQWGNLRSGARIVEVNEKTIVAESVAWDLESNFAISVQASRRITTKKGKRYSDDMINVTGNAAIAVAFRNAVFRVVPDSLTSKVFSAVKKAAVGNVENIAERWTEALKQFASLGVVEEQIRAALEIGSRDTIKPAHIQRLAGFWTALQDRDATLESIFPSVAEVREGNEGVKEALKKSTDKDDYLPGTDPRTEEEKTEEARAGVKA